MADVDAGVTKGRRPRRPIKAALPNTPDPIEIAMAALASDATADNPARALLNNQNSLVQQQCKLAGWQIIGERTGAILKGLTALAGVVFLLLAGLFAWSASRADGVVVTPFAVPPELARRGLTGPVVATQVLDRLTRLEEQTESMRIRSSYANDWGEDIAVEIPYAGVSLGELRRYLREWLGRQTRLSGEVFRLPDDRFAVTMRVGAKPGARFEGAEAELDALLDKGAEAVYAQTQPYRYSNWLGVQGRNQEAANLRKELANSAEENDRLWANIAMGSASSNYRQRLRYYNQALSIRPGFMTAHYGIANTESSYGNDEIAFNMTEEVLRNERSFRQEVEPGRADFALLSLESLKRRLQGNYAGALEPDRAALARPTNANNRIGAWFSLAFDHAFLHDAPAAAEAARVGLEQRKPADRGALLSDNLGPEVLVPLATNDHAELARQIEQRQDLLAQRDRDGFGSLRALLATAQARAGRLNDAAASIRTTPLGCDPCLRARGLIAGLSSRHGEADAWFRKTVQRTPSLPLGHGAWAEALLRRGAVEPAIEQARLAHQKGPGWAEPLRTWGEALVLQKSFLKAEKKYAAAASLAPQWGALHLDWARVLWRLGRRDEARRKMRMAGTMSLNLADRELLRRMWTVAQRQV